MSLTIKIHDSDDIARSYYCNNKFRFLKIDLESKMTYNCHAASSHPVDFDWLEKNPGNLFNTEVNVVERKMMLQNQRNPSCEQNCWRAEDQGAQSPRLWNNGIDVTHVEPRTNPEIIDLTIGSHCNLTCSYCFKGFSSAWRRDVVVGGNYVIDGVTDDRYTANDRDLVLSKISQPELSNTRDYQILLNEIKLLLPSAQKLVISGGEPLLHNHLISELENFELSNQATIEIWTGLGLSASRFQKMLDKLKQIKNLTIVVSAETTEKLFEFNRYGAKWDEFVTKIELLKHHNINLKFNSTVTNLTIFGFKKFYEFFQDEKIKLTFAYQPMMMAPYVLDQDSKQRLKKDLSTLPSNFADPLIQSIEAEPTETERLAIQDFLKEFTTRRKDLTLDIFPKTFLQWSGLEHVV
jgi:organic radical activating enzyme